MAYSIISRVRSCLLLLGIGGSVLPACQAKHETERTEIAAGVAPAPAAASEAQTLAQLFGPIIRGAWVNANYLALLRQTKSPIIAADSIGDVSEMTINPSERMGDSLSVGLGLGNHEGGNMTVYFRPSQSLRALPTSYQVYNPPPGSKTELGYQFTPHDTILLLTTYTKSRKIFTQATYKRIRRVETDELEALNQAVNQLLFTGNYKGIDSLGHPVQITFSTDGRVEGITGFKSYYVNTDFEGGPGLDIDHLILDRESKHLCRLNYSHSAHTLRLYTAPMLDARLIPGAKDAYFAPELIRGRLLYTLTRRLAQK